MDNPASVTGRYLKKPLPHPLQARRPIDGGTSMIRVEGAHLHNLRNVAASLPIGRLSVVTGVSRSEEHTSELQSLMRISYAVFCLKIKTKQHTPINHNIE